MRMEVVWSGGFPVLIWPEMGGCWFGRRSEGEGEGDNEGEGSIGVCGGQREEEMCVTGKGRTEENPPTE
ncbi:hypothetical protein HAX54_031268, partial [Datura stramonium]|nr:hypothetical protein [Datura stramonium]